MITLAVAADLPDILNIYEYARNFMIKNGNPTQWTKDYPGVELLLKDIAKKHLYLCRDALSVYGVFAFIIGEDPTYRLIENGAWLSHLRIDTHRDNLIMQHILPAAGFQKCGMIYLTDGSLRIAYERL